MGLAAHMAKSVLFSIKLVGDSSSRITMQTLNSLGYI